MKKLATIAISTLVLLSSSIGLSDTWTCRTSDIWNGRSSYPFFARGDTKKEAYYNAAWTCKHSGQERYCLSVISCWN